MNKTDFLRKCFSKRPYLEHRNNYDLLPDTLNQQDMLNINCLTHGLFRQRVLTHLRAGECPNCLTHGNKTTDDFITRARAVHGLRFDYSAVDYKNSRTEIQIICPTHGEFFTTPHDHIACLTGCKKCNKELPRIENMRKLLEESKKVHNDKYNYDLVSLTAKSTTKVEIKCVRHGIFLQDLYTHAIKCAGCPSCALEANKVSREEFIKRAMVVHSAFYTYENVLFSKLSDKVIVRCPLHGLFEQRANSHLAGNNCGKCHITSTLLGRDKFIEAAIAMHGDRYDYSKVVYAGNKRRVEVICKRHGSFFVKPNSHTSAGTGCRLCYESRGERAVTNFLIRNFINFEREYVISPYRFRYDFFLPDFNVFIEFHGKQHYEPVAIFGGMEAFKDQKIRDAFKAELVKKQAGSLIIVNYLDLQINDFYIRLGEKLQRNGVIIT